MLRKRKRRRAQARDIEQMHPDQAAQLCRSLSRAGTADLRTIALLAKRGQASDLPGQRAAMHKYERAALAGRRVCYGILRITVLDEMPEDERSSFPWPVEPELEEAVEEALNDNRS